MTAPASGNAARGAGARADGLAEGIARLRGALRRGARVASPGNPLAVAQLELLSVVAEHPGTRPGQLARLLHMRPNTVTTIVNTLTTRGMISRATADGDRRAIELTATEAGQQAVHAWQATNAAGTGRPRPVTRRQLRPMRFIRRAAAGTAPRRMLRWEAPCSRASPGGGCARILALPRGWGGNPLDAWTLTVSGFV